MLLAKLLVMASMAVGQGSDPSGVLSEFISAVASSDTAGAMGLLSEEAFEKVDSLLENNPVFLCNLAQGFGVKLQPAEVQGMESRAFLRAVLSSPALAGMLMFARYTPGEPFIDGDDILLPVAYRFMGTADTLTLKMTESEGAWLISDYYGHAPVRPTRL